MRSSRLRRASIASSLFVVLCASAVQPGSALAAGPNVWAIVGARIVTVSGPPIERGTVVVRGGLIEAVGANVTPPADARVVDAAGLTVYPGLIDAFSFVEEDQQAQQGPQGRGRGPGGGEVRAPSVDDPLGVTPARDALDIVKPDGRIEAARSAGITTTLAVPKGGIFRGTSALVDSGGASAREMSVKSPVALHVAFEAQGGFASYPGSVMGVFAVVRQRFLDAGQYEREWARYSSTPRGWERPALDPKLAAIVPAIDRKLPVVLEASSDREIRRALRVADEFQLGVMIAGGLESPTAAQTLVAHKAPVLLSLNFPERPVDLDAETREPLRDLRARADAPGVAAKLRAAGVKFAFASYGLKSPSQFRTNAIKAVDAGLPKEDALRAMTLTPAELFGVSEQLGSIEPGKIANLVVTDGDLFVEKTKIKYVFVDGVRTELPAEPASAKPSDAPATSVAGTWAITASTPDGPQAVTLTLAQSGSTVTGTFAHPLFGTSEVKNGQLAADKLTFTVTITVQGSTLDIAFNGTVKDDTMSGTVALPGQGSFEFSGKRTPQGASR